VIDGKNMNGKQNKPAIRRIVVDMICYELADEISGRTLSVKNMAGR